MNHCHDTNLTFFTYFYFISYHPNANNILYIECLPTHNTISQKNKTEKKGINKNEIDIDIAVIISLSSIPNIIHTRMI